MRAATPSTEKVLSGQVEELARCDYLGVLPVGGVVFFVAGDEIVGTGGVGAL
jgi:hypothetical protein